MCEQNRVVKIVLTGGPCAGKTTGLVRVREHLENLGWKVVVLRETATDLINGGVAVNTFKDPVEFQRLLFRLQLEKENLVEKSFQGFGCPVVILCDRGLCDAAAYIGKEEFTEMLLGMGLSYGELFDRYDAVIHLVTAAIGAIEAYTTSNNHARGETAEQAKALDVATQDAWVGHNHLRLIKNNGDFDAKMTTLLKEICAVLGVPEPLECERKFLVKMPDLAALRRLDNCAEVKILQTYLKPDKGGGERRLRIRSLLGHDTYVLTRKKPTGDLGSRIETERNLSAEEYLQYLKERDRRRSSINKTRFCIMDRETGHYLELDVYDEDRRYAVLEIETATLHELVRFPGCLQLMREVTGDERFSNHSIALHGGRLPL